MILRRKDMSYHMLFMNEFIAVHCVFEEYMLVWLSQHKYFENVEQCSKHMNKYSQQAFELRCHILFQVGSTLFCIMCFWKETFRLKILVDGLTLKIATSLSKGSQH